MSNSALYKEIQSSETRLCVIVPVKDEEDYLSNTLEALYFQNDADSKPISQGIYEVLLLVNNSTDKSYHIALEYQKKHPNFQLHIADINLDEEVAHIGTVRRLLMDEAYSRFMSNNKPDGIIASTDGDSEVDSGWVYNIILAIDKGIDVVGGRIISKKTSQLSRLHHLQNVTYRHYVSRLEAFINPCAHDPWPRHFQCYGPSVAVTCEAYDRAGRLPILPFLEDEEFRKALYRVDAKVRLCPNVKVYTSSRLAGRVDFGFSVQLQHWAKMNSNGMQVEVESLQELLEKFELKRLLKKAWQQPRDLQGIGKILSEIANRLQLSKTWLLLEYKNSKHFGSLWEKIEQHISDNKLWRKRYPLIPIVDAIRLLRHYFFGQPQLKVSEQTFALKNTA